MQYCNSFMVLFFGLIFLGCQPSANNSEPVPSNGSVLTGDLAGNEFLMATGDEDEKMMDLVDAFNRMDLDGVWEHIADTISFHGADGYEGPFTKDMLGDLFSTADSVSWQVWAVIPVQVKGSNRVSVLIDSHEKIYLKDGSVNEHKLFERFIFEDGTITGIRQWNAAVSAENSN